MTCYKIYNKRDDFSSPIVKFPSFNGDVILEPSCGVSIPKLLWYVPVGSDDLDLNERNFRVTGEVLSQEI